MCKYLKKTVTPKRDRATTIGLVQYMSQFIPCLSESTQPLRALLHKDVEWQWTSSHEQAFIKLKELIHEDLTLKYFDPNILSVIEVYSSLNGLGAVITEWKTGSVCQ